MDEHFAVLLVQILNILHHSHHVGGMERHQHGHHIWFILGMLEKFIIYFYLLWNCFDQFQEV